MKDRLTPELRKIESQVDHHYKSNPLMNLPFATAAWYLLAAAEDDILIQKLTGIDGIQDLHGLASDFVGEIEHPMSWLYGACEPGGQIPCVFDDDLYKASRDLFELGRKYDWFVFAYTCASNGVLGLELQGSTIQPTGDFFTGIEYEAYNVLIDPYQEQEALSLMNFDNFPINAIKHSLRVQGDRFHYKLKPKIISDTITCLKAAFDKMFLLPSEWKFSRYSLGDFRRVFEAICAIAHIRWIARCMAMRMGCSRMGCADSIYAPTCDELLRRVVRYSGVSDAKVQSIFDDLSYGNKGILHPQPALQPLIKLNSETCAILPHLWICSAAEVNFTRLLNKLPSEKGIYAKLVNEKEGFMRQRFTNNLSDRYFRLIWGNVSDLPDVDIAIIKDSEKTCLLLELKWFIAPAVARERIEKSEEIEKGVSQVLKLKRAFANNHKPLLEKLKIDASYRLEGIVVSDNWIGYANVQSPEIPVIRADHLIAKLRTAESLESTIEWLKDRKYLPKEGEHFKVYRPTTRIGNWTLKWYGIESLIDDAFFPL